MPELPEVEQLRRSLEPHLVGAVVVRALLRRRDFLDRTALPPRSRADDALLLNRRIASVRRHGKQLAIVADDGQSLCVHLGMSGQLTVMTPGIELPETHRHAEWTLRSPNNATFRMIFRDPRRFGGLWGLPDLSTLEQRWNCLGPDALNIRSNRLAEILGSSKRAVKTVLLDQSKLAGVGNIYADEALFRARVSPALAARAVSRDACRTLATTIRSVLREAVARGGSSIRDYLDGTGQRGSFQLSHYVYGRAGQACVQCSTSLSQAQLGGRTTVWCPNCQRG